MGINMAFMAALKVYRVLLTRPSYTSLERRVKMMSFGAHLILTDLTTTMRGTVKKAYDLLENTPDASMLRQFSNPTNTKDCPDYEDSRARGFVHRSLDLQSFACLYLGIRYPRSS
ncbi:bifunctional L-3-cyanoalanine synthase/cysteine synthase C1, mitochondrial-like protein [Tanacetum coccineum]